MAYSLYGSTKGSSGISSLMRSAGAAQNSTNSYNDALQAYQFAQSAKSQDDLTAYQDYLKTRYNNESHGVGGSGPDPMKALTIQKAIESARTQFNSAEIQRVNTQINYGNMGLEDKRNALIKNYNDAVANGDMSQAQTIEMQYTSVDKQMQDQAQAAATKAQNLKLGGYDTETAANYAQTLTNAQHQAQVLKLAFDQGKSINIDGKNIPVTASNYAALLGHLNDQQNQLYQKMQSEPDGTFSAADAEKLTGKASSFYSTADLKNYNAQTRNEVLNGATPYGYKETPIGNGQYTREPVKLPVTAENANGVKTYQQTGYLDKNKSSFLRRVQQPGGHVDTQVGDVMQSDTNGPDKGVPYVVDSQGKRYIAKDASSSANGKVVMTAKNPQDILDWESGKTLPSGVHGENLAQAVVQNTFENGANVVSKAAKLGAKVPAVRDALLTTGANMISPQLGAGLSSFLSFNNMRSNQLTAAALAKQNAAAVQQRQAAATLAAQQQRAGAIPAPPPAPVKTATPSFTPQPGQPNYVPNVTRAQQVMNNPGSTPFQAVEALRGGINAGGF